MVTAFCTMLWPSVLLSVLLRRHTREFRGVLVVRILGVHCCGPSSILGQGTEILKAKRSGQKKKKKMWGEIHQTACSDHSEEVM